LSGEILSDERNPHVWRNNVEGYTTVDTFNRYREWWDIRPGEQPPNHYCGVATRYEKTDANYFSLVCLASLVTNIL
jgi:hypothetical protein